MQTTIDTFNERVAEIDLYYEAIKELYSEKNSDNNSFKFFEEDFLKILKSNALLMIYNLVESSIMGGIISIYDEFKHNNISYCDVRSEIQKIWFSYKFNQVYGKTAHYNSYKDKAAEIINEILSNRILILDRKATDISGNLDADKIRKICQEHGIQYIIPKDCKGGIVLSDVKEKRNYLAHGTVSFVECGRYYTIEDIEKIKNETKIFLEAILQGMKKYYDDKQYLKNKNMINGYAYS